MDLRKDPYCRIVDLQNSQHQSRILPCGIHQSEHLFEILWGKCKLPYALMSGKPHLVHIVGFYKGQNIDLQYMLVLKDTLYLSDNQWYIIQRHN